MRGPLTVALLLGACGPGPGSFCADDAACGNQMVCQKPPGSANGICSFPYSGAGERCSSNGDCAAGLFCSNDLSTGTRQFAGACQPLQGQDAPCLRTANCQPPLTCQGVRDGQLGACR